MSTVYVIMYQSEIFEDIYYTSEITIWQRVNELRKFSADYWYKPLEKKVSLDDKHYEDVGQ